MVKRGRYAEAERNDAAILDAARAVLVADPGAPIAAIAKRAGVGMGAIYNRYGSKEELIRVLLTIGLDTYLTELEAALAAEGDAWDAYIAFLTNILEADTHSLAIRLAGTFTPTDEQNRKADRTVELGVELFTRAQASGRMRQDVTYLDVSGLLSAIAHTTMPTPERTAEIRKRQLALVVDGLRCEGATPLPGAAPTWEEEGQRWNN